MARALIVGCGCRGRALGSALIAVGLGGARHAAATRRRWRRSRPRGSRRSLADPDRVGDAARAPRGRRPSCSGCSARRPAEEEAAAVHGPRLERMLEKLVDSPVRGFVYEAAGTVDAEVLAGGRRLVREAAERWRIPVRLIEADPRQHRALARRRSGGGRGADRRLAGRLAVLREVESCCGGSRVPVQGAWSSTVFGGLSSSVGKRLAADHHRDRRRRRRCRTASPGGRDWRCSAAPTTSRRLSRPRASVSLILSRSSRSSGGSCSITVFGPIDGAVMSEASLSSSEPDCVVVGQGVVLLRLVLGPRLAGFALGCLPGVRVGPGCRPRVCVGRGFGLGGGLRRCFGLRRAGVGRRRPGLRPRLRIVARAAERRQLPEGPFDSVGRSNPYPQRTLNGAPAGLRRQAFREMPSENSPRN